MFERRRQTRETRKQRFCHWFPKTDVVFLFWTVHTAAVGRWYTALQTQARSTGILNFRLSLAVAFNSEITVSSLFFDEKSFAGYVKTAFSDDYCKKLYCGSVSKIVNRTPRDITVSDRLTVTGKLAVKRSLPTCPSNPNVYGFLCNNGRYDNGVICRRR